VLARKVVHVMRAAEQLLSRQPNYDFGMRALKSVLLAAGASLRCTTTTKRTNHDIMGNDDDLHNQRASLELASLANTLHEMLLPKLTSADSLVVEGIIQVLLRTVLVFLWAIWSQIFVVFRQMHLSYLYERK
jgi:dynein heavy chain 1, cytosolic